MNIKYSLTWRQIQDRGRRVRGRNARIALWFAVLAPTTTLMLCLTAVLAALKYFT